MPPFKKWNLRSAVNENKTAICEEVVFFLDPDAKNAVPVSGKSRNLPQT